MKYTITEAAKTAYKNGEDVRVTKDGKEVAIINRAGLEKFFNGASVPVSALKQGYPGCAIDVVHSTVIN